MFFEIWVLNFDFFDKMERVARIELATTAWEAVVLPLNHTRIYPERFLSLIFARGIISKDDCLDKVVVGIIKNQFSIIKYGFLNYQ